MEKPEYSVDQSIATVEDLGDGGVDHIGRSSNDTMFGIDTDIGRAAYTDTAAEGSSDGGGRVVAAKRQLDAITTESLGQEHGCDAHSTDGTMGAIGGQDSILYGINDNHIWAVEGIGAQVFSRAKAAREEQSIVIGGGIVGQGQDGTAADAGRLLEDVALLGIGQGALLETLVLIGRIGVTFGNKKPLRGKTLDSGATAVDGEKERERLLQLATIAVATATKDNSKLFHRQKSEKKPATPQ